MADDMERGEVRVEEVLNAFLYEHRDCGELDTGMIELSDGAARLWLTCDSCGARLDRPV